MTNIWRIVHLSRSQLALLPIRQLHFYPTAHIADKIFDNSSFRVKYDTFLRFSSITTQQTRELDVEEGGPQGNLFHASIGDTLLNKTASLRRTFSPRCNAQAMLICGGPMLAAHASFDPNFDRARSYIRNHAVGPAVLSPVLISGLIGALVEASLPQSFLISSNMTQHLPLIVGVQVEATIKVSSVMECNRMDRSFGTADDSSDSTRGYELLLRTEVKRVTDDRIISEGSQNIWMPCREKL